MNKNQDQRIGKIPGVKHKIRNVISNLPRWLRAVFILAGFFATLYILLRIIPFPGLDDFIYRQNSTRFYDKNGVLLNIMPLDDGLRREYYPLDEIPESVKDVFIRAEDKNFYHHGGIDIGSIFRALYQNRKASRVVSGASTITMQLVRLIIPRTPGKRVTILQKTVEAVQAVHLEAHLSKSKILELYLNSIPFGSQAEGVGSAARTFFGKSLKSLNEAQIYALAVVPRRPSEYNPIDHPKNSYTAAMEIGAENSFYVSPKEWITDLHRSNEDVYPSKCPHFINYIIEQYTQRKIRLPDVLRLSIDCQLNGLISAAIMDDISEYSDARIRNGAAFVINNKTGQIEAWVGNGNFYDPDSGQIDGVLVKNQAGSSMKPFLYALALESGFEPNMVLPDIPMDFGSEQVYVPMNFNNRCNGPQRMRVCLASSLNIPAVYLLYRLGIDNYFNKLVSLGFHSLIGTRHQQGLSLALGSGEVTLYELVRGFSLFPNDGIIPNITWFRDFDNTTAVEFTSKENLSGYKSDTTRIICDMLSDKQARSLGFGFAYVFDTPYPAIFKTGTSNQFQDIVALGATTGYTAGVWLGNFSGETVIKKTGSSIPAGIVRKILDYLTKEYPESAMPFKKPELYAKKKICVLSGMLAGSYCPAVTFEYIKSRSVSEKLPKCTWHTEKGGRVHITYPSEYQHWGGSLNYKGSFHSDEKQLHFLYPTDGAVFIYDESIPEEVQKICIEAVGSDFAELFVDGKSLGSQAGRLMWIIHLKKGIHILKVKKASINSRIQVLVK